MPTVFAVRISLSGIAGTNPDTATTFSLVFAVTVVAKCHHKQDLGKIAPVHLEKYRSFVYNVRINF